VADRDPKGPEKNEVKTSMREKHTGRKRKARGEASKHRKEKTHFSKSWKIINLT